MKNWTNIFQKIFFRIDKSDTDQIIDGVIVSDDTIHHPIIPEPTVEEREPRIYPLAIPQYYPSFLVDKNSGGDTGLFIHWLQNHRYKAIMPYIRDLTQWKESLIDHVDASEIIRVLNSFGVTRAKRLLYTLRLYARYRYNHGDPRLLILLAVSEEYLKLPNAKKNKSEIILSVGTIEMLNDKAKSFCLEGYMIGAWIGLLMRGVPASAIESLEIQEDRRIRFRVWTAMRERRLPEWLWLALTQRIAENLWRRNRVTIRNKVRKYQNPTILFNNSETVIRVLGE